MARAIVCPNCGASIPEKMVYENQEFAVCPYCKTIYDWKDKSEKTKVYNLDKPKDFEVERQKDQLIIRFPPISSLAKIQIVGMALVLNFFLLSAICNLANPAQSRSDDMGGGLLCLMCGIPLTLFFSPMSFLVLVNRSMITADRERVRYSADPIALGSIVFKTSDIQQIFVKDKHQSTKHRSYFVYRVMVLLANGDRKPLVHYVRNPDHALYIEQELEAFLNLEPAKVRGAYKDS